MSMGPLGYVGGVAGSQLPQTKGADADRAAKDVGDQARANESGDRAQSAEGVGETGEQEQATDRDADGRRIWEQVDGEREDGDPSLESRDEPRTSRDPSGQRGKRLDLSG